jgi:hypothetical protein
MPFKNVLCPDCNKTKKAYLFITADNKFQARCSNDFCKRRTKRHLTFDTAIAAWNLDDVIQM